MHSTAMCLLALTSTAVAMPLIRQGDYPEYIEMFAENVYKRIGSPDATAIDNVYKRIGSPDAAAIDNVYKRIGSPDAATIDNVYKRIGSPDAAANVYKRIGSPDAASTDALEEHHEEISIHIHE